MHPKETQQELTDVLQNTADMWHEELEEFEDVSAIVLTGFFVIAEYQTPESNNILLTIAGDGQGGEPTEWLVRGWLDYAKDFGLYGLSYGDGGDED